MSYFPKYSEPTRFELFALTVVAIAVCVFALYGLLTAAYVLVSYVQIGWI